jgi:hypothetical protein
MPARLRQLGESSGQVVDVRVAVAQEQNANALCGRRIDTGLARGGSTPGEREKTGAGQQPQSGGCTTSIE